MENGQGNFPGKAQNAQQGEWWVCRHVKNTRVFREYRLGQRRNHVVLVNDLKHRVEAEQNRGEAPAQIIFQRGIHGRAEDIGKAQERDLQLRCLAAKAVDK